MKNRSRRLTMVTRPTATVLPMQADDIVITPRPSIVADMRERLPHLVAVLILLVSVLSIGALPMYAGTVRTEMLVSTTVIARALVNVNQEPEAIVVTPADVIRGYVDLDVPLVVSVRTNSRQGYILQATKTDSRFAAAELHSDGMVLRVNDAIELARPYSGTAGERLQFRVRLIIANGMAEGRYPFPIALTATPA